MMRRSVLLALTISCFSFALTEGIFAQRASTLGSDAHWPQFRGPDRNGVSDSKNLMTQWPKGGPPLVWETRGAGRGYSSVSIADGKLYTMGDSLSDAPDKAEHLVCFDVTNGKPLWKQRLGPAWNEGRSDWQSSRSTPTVDGDHLYALTPHGDLICLQTSGKEVWRKNLKDDFDGKKGDGWGYSESVLIDGDRLICTPGGERKTMVALDKTNGRLLWSSSRDGDRGAGHASIVKSDVNGTAVYVQTTASGALGVRANDGRLLWTHEIERTTAVIPTHIVRDDLVFFAAGYGRGGALLRQVPKGNRIDIEVVYPLNNKLANKHGGIVLVGDYLYGDSEDNGRPFCAEFMTGREMWRERGSGRGSASITAADGHLYIRFSNSVVALAKADPRAYKEISTFEIPGGSDRPSWSHLAITGGRLYLREHDKIFCYDLRAQG